LKVRWTRLALADFASAQSYIAAENPQAAMEIARSDSLSLAGGSVGGAAESKEGSRDKEGELRCECVVHDNVLVVRS
jgi:plasmid stabilization system protein ParE